MKRFRPLLWLLWCLIIAAPLVFVGLEYEWGKGLWNATLRTDRLRFLVSDIPAWVGGHWLDVIGVLVFLGAVVGFLKLWQLTAWVQWRGEVETRTRGRVRQAGAMIVVILILTLSCRHLADTQIEWGVMVCTYILLALGLNLIVGMTGLLVLGYAGFVAVGAYTFAVLHQQFGLSLWLAFLPAALVGPRFRRCRSRRGRCRGN